MFGEFLGIILKSIKLDKSLYSDNKNFGEASIYFAGLIMILDGIAGAVAANTVIKTAVAMSGLTAILTWFIWAIFIFVIGVKLFPDKQSKVPFKKVLTAVGFAHAPGLLRFFAVTPDLMIPIIFLTQFWIFAGLIISTKQVLNLKSNFKSFGIVFLSFLIIAFLSISFVMGSKILKEAKKIALKNYSSFGISNKIKKTSNNIYKKIHLVETADLNRKQI